MNYNLTGKHMELTPSIKEAVTSALEQSRKVHDGVTNIRVILSHEQRNYVAEAILHIAGKDVFVKSVMGNMYDAIADMGDKAAHSLQKAKGKHGNIDHTTLKRLYHEEV